MFRRHSLLPGIFALCAILSASSLGFGADWDQFPPLEPREHVALKKRFDGPKYDDLRTCYRRFDSRVGADYYAAMVDVTAESGSRSRKQNDGRPFADALYQAWKEEGRLDDKDDVLVVLGLRNRSIAIRPGAKWKKLGFDGEVIDNTIEASHYEKHRRRRNYIEALCSLANAVDLRLASLEQEMAKRVAQVQQRLPALDKKLSALHETVSTRFEKLPSADHPFGKKLLAQLAAARTKLDDAKSLVEDKPKEAVLLADEVEAVLQPVRADLETFNEDMGRLDAAQKELAALQATIEKREDLEWEEPQAALLQLAKCEHLAEKIRKDYDARPSEVRDCRREAEIHLGRADVHFYYLRSVLPALAIGLLAMLLLGFIILRRLRRRRALRQLESDLGEWRRRLDDSSQRLYELELACPSYFAGGRMPWHGESASIDQGVADAAGQMTQLLDQGRDILARAEALHKKSHPLDAKRLEEALALLREAPVSVDGPYTGDAASLLGDVDAAHRQALARLDDVVETTDHLAEQSARAAEAVTKATCAVEARRELGLPADHLGDPLEGALDAWKTATRLSATDPTRAAAIFEETASRLDDVVERAEMGNEAARRVQGPIAETGQMLDQKIRQLRFARIDIGKLRFDPKQELDAAKRQASRILDLVARAREEEAFEAVESLQADLDRVAGRLEVVAEADEHAPRRAEALASRGKELKEQLMKMSYTLKSLPNKEAYGQESKKVSRYQTRINRLTKPLKQVQREHAAKHYLAASEELDAITDLLDAADMLLADLGHLEQRVEDAEAQARELFAACEPSVRELQARAKQPGVCKTLRTLSSEQAVSLQMIGDQMRSDEAHWLEIRDQLHALHKLTEFSRAEIDADLEALERARSLAAELTDDLSNAAPAPEHQQVVAYAREMLAGWRAQLEEGTDGGLTLLRTGREVAKAVARALKVSSGNTPLRLTVASVHSYALSRYHEVHGRQYGYGVVGDCGHLVSELDRATATVDAGDYPSALVLLEAAIEQIELEDARADACGMREYRAWQAKIMVPDTTTNALEGTGMLGNRPSWTSAASTLGEPSGATQA